MPADQVTRLVELEVQEISLVDRPANQRKFLVVKSASGDSPMPHGAELTHDGKGGLTAPAAKTDPEPAAKADEPATEAKADDKPAEPKADDAVAPPAAPTEKSALEAIQAEIVALLASVEPVEKVGRKMAGPRLAKLRELYKAIGDLLAEVDDEVEKSAPAPAVNSAEMERLAKSVHTLTALVKRQSTELKELRGGVRPSSNTTTVGEEPTNVADHVVWPADFNANHNPEDDIF